MNEAETRAEYIDPKLKAGGWGEIEVNQLSTLGVDSIGEEYESIA